MAVTGAAPFRVRRVTRAILGMGDSKTNGIGSTDGNGYFSYFTNEYIESLGRLARNGYTVALWQSKIDADIAAAVGVPDKILVNLGTNDLNPLDPPLDQATWEAGYAYILDALHTAWPNADIYCMKVWRRFSLPQIGDLNDVWIANVISTRSWAQYGPDERIFLENGDNGVAYTGDGIHPNDAGYELTWAEWLKVI